MSKQNEESGAAELESRLKRLKEIVESLEGGELELGDALDLFQEGVEHVRTSRKVIEESELRIENVLEELGTAA